MLGRSWGMRVGVGMGCCKLFYSTVFKKDLPQSSLAGLFN